MPKGYCFSLVGSIFRTEDSNFWRSQLTAFNPVCLQLTFLNQLVLNSGALDYKDQRMHK